MMLIICTGLLLTVVRIHIILKYGIIQTYTHQLYEI
jgi:hypothetical protein